MTTLAELKTFARRQVRDATGAKADAMILAAINAGLRMIGRERQWAWFQTHGVLTLQAPYSTGTITLTNGSANVELAGGTWPTWAASGKILYNGKWMRIASKTDNDTLVLTAAWADATVSGAAYVLYRDEYTLAADCGRFGRLFPGTGWVWGGEASSFEDVLSAYNAYSGGQKYPSMWAIYKDQIIVWPYAESSTTVNYMYYRLPAALALDTDVADWDTMQDELLERAIDYQLALTFGNAVSGDVGTCRALYADALTRAIRNEKQPASRGSWFGASTREMMPTINYAP